MRAVPTSRVGELVAREERFRIIQGVTYEHPRGEEQDNTRVTVIFSEPAPRRGARPHRPPVDFHIADGLPGAPRPQSRAHRARGSPSFAAVRTYSAASPWVANQTRPVPFEAMCARSCSSATMRERCPEMWGCSVSTIIVPSS